MIKLLLGAPRPLQVVWHAYPEERPRQKAGLRKSLKN